MEPEDYDDGQDRDEYERDAEMFDGDLPWTSNHDAPDNPPGLLGAAIFGLIVVLAIVVGWAVLTYALAHR